MIKRAGIRSTMAKIAFNADDAGKVLKLFKGRQAPKGLVRQNKSMQTYMGIPDNVKSWASSMYPDNPKSLLDDLEKSPLQAGMTVAPHSRDSFQFFKDMGVNGKITSMDGKNRRMLDAVVKGHELDEIVVPGNRNTLMDGSGMNHRSPDVILREHNRIMTLPEGYDKVKDTMTNLRSNIGREADYLANATDSSYSGKGFEYGQSPRLSRHARKRITQLWENKIKSIRGE